MPCEREHGKPAGPGCPASPIFSSCQPELAIILIQYQLLTRTVLRGGGNESTVDGPASTFPDGDCERQVWGMKTRFRDRGRTAAVASVKRPSPRRIGATELRRFLPFAS
jgi:hypothetical protein